MQTCLTQTHEHLIDNIVFHFLDILVKGFNSQRILMDQFYLSTTSENVFRIQILHKSYYEWCMIKPLSENLDSTHQLESFKWRFLTLDHVKIYVYISLFIIFYYWENSLLKIFTGKLKRQTLLEYKGNDHVWSECKLSVLLEKSTSTQTGKVQGNRWDFLTSASNLDAHRKKKHLPQAV